MATVAFGEGRQPRYHRGKMPLPQKERRPNFDELVKSRKTPFFVIPAEAGIQSNQVVLDPGVRRGDGLVDFL